MKHAYHGRMCTPHWAHDSAFGSSIRLDICHLDENLVAVHSRADCVRRNENVRGNSRCRLPGTCARASRLIRDYEAEAVAMQAEFSCNEILSLCSLRDAVAVGIGLDQLS